MSSIKAFLGVRVKNKSSIVTVALIMLRGGGLKVASLYLHQKRPSHSASARTATPTNYLFFAPLVGDQGGQPVRNINLVGSSLTFIIYYSDFSHVFLFWSQVIFNTMTNVNKIDWRQSNILIVGSI